MGGCGFVGCWLACGVGAGRSACAGQAGASKSCSRIQKEAISLALESCSTPLKIEPKSKK